MTAVTLRTTTDLLDQLVEKVLSGGTPSKTQIKKAKAEVDALTIGHYEMFIKQFEKLLGSIDSDLDAKKHRRARARYTHVKRVLTYKNANTGIPLTRKELAAEVGLTVAAVEPYVRLHDFEAAYNASEAYHDFIVVVADGKGGLLLTPEVGRVRDHHIVLKKRMVSMLERIAAVHFTDKVQNEAR